MLKWILGFFHKSRKNLCSCGLPRITKETEIIVWGTQVTLTNSPQCKSCSEKSLAEWATRCDKCGTPICTGEAVAAGKTPDTYIHLDMCCPNVPILFIGFWGKGKLDHYVK
jgi:ribosomal protein L37E